MKEDILQYSVNFSYQYTSYNDLYAAVLVTVDDTNIEAVCLHLMLLSNGLIERFEAVQRGNTPLMFVVAEHVKSCYEAQLNRVDEHYELVAVAEIFAGWLYFLLEYYRDTFHEVSHTDVDLQADFAAPQAWGLVITVPCTRHDLLPAEVRRRLALPKTIAVEYEFQQIESTKILMLNVIDSTIETWCLYLELLYYQHIHTYYLHEFEQKVVAISYDQHASQVDINIQNDVICLTLTSIELQIWRELFGCLYRDGWSQIAQQTIQIAEWDITLQLPQVRASLIEPGREEINI